MGIVVVNKEKKEYSYNQCPYLASFNTPFLMIHLSASETLICHKEIEFNGVYFLGFARNAIHNFQIVVLDSQCHYIRQIPQKRTDLHFCASVQHLG